MPRDSPTAQGSPLPQRELLRRYSWLVLLTIGARGLGFLAVVLMARGLGVEVFGEVSFARVVGGYGLTLTVFGLGIWGVRAVIRDPASTGTVASTVIVIRLTLATLAFTALALLTLLPPFRSVAGLIILFALTLFSAAISVLWVAQSQQRTDLIGISNLVAQLLFLAQVFLAIKLGFGKHAIPLALVVSELVANLGLLIWMNRNVAALERPLGLAECRRVVGRAAPIAAAQFLRVFSLSSDLVLLGMLVTMDQVGAYGAAYKIRVLGFALVGLYMAVVLPHLTQHGKVSVRQLSSEVGSLLWKMVLLAAPLALAAIALAPWVLDTLFGPEYTVATSSMRLLIVATLFTLVGSHYRPAILALGENKSDLRNVALGSGVHVAAKLGLIPLFGLAGAALGTVVGETTYAAASWLTLRRFAAAENQSTLDPADIENGSLAGRPPAAGLDLE